MGHGNFIKQREVIRIIAFCKISLIITVLVYSNLIFAEDIRVALRANKGEATALNQWQATVDYLNEKIPEHHFILVPFENNSALNQAVSRNEFQFCLTNPASAVEHQVRY